jgi:hypothetical protein
MNTCEYGLYCHAVHGTKKNFSLAVTLLVDFEVINIFVRILYKDFKLIYICGVERKNAVSFNSLTCPANQNMQIFTPSLPIRL